MRFKNITVAIVTCLLPLLCWSTPIHQHCLVLPWSIQSSFGGAGVVIPNPVPTTSIFGLPIFDGLPPDTDACRYELSDITSIAITLIFSNAGLYSSYAGVIVSDGMPGFMGSALPLTPGGGSVDTSLIPLTSGITRTFPFVAHDNSTGGYLGGNPPTGFGTPTGFGFPIPYMDIRFFTSLTSADGAAVAITSGTVVVRGRHYYVPEPSTFILSLATLGALALRQRASFSGVHHV